jgi:sugar transferase (PEP-CTERM/EpsH1 system associated)
MNRKYRLLHIIDSLAVGGMERIVIEVANGLAPALFEQAVCCLSRMGDGAAQLRDSVRCIDLGKGAGADYFMPRKIARVIREFRPDIVHSQSWSGIDAAIATLLSPRIALVHSEHGRNYPYLHFEPLKRRIARRLLYARADAVFAVSAELRDYYCKQVGFPTDRMRVIPNGINLERIDGAEAGNLRGELGIAPDEFVIGTVARLDKTKDTLTLCRAFARIVRNSAGEKRPLRLLIVGEGEQKETLRKFSLEQGLVHEILLTGVRHDVPQLLKVMDLFSLPSLSEGLPITILEAMSASLPIVAARVGALPEVVEEGVTGFLVEPQRDDLLSERILRLYEHRAEAAAFGRAGRKKIESAFGIDGMLRQYEALYLRVLKSLEKSREV